MADYIDEAQAVNELHFEVSLRNHRLRQPVQPEGWDGRSCVECGEPVEAARLKLGFFVCIDCKTYNDRVEAAKQRNGRPEEADGE